MKSFFASMFSLLFFATAFAGTFVDGNVQRTAILRGEGYTIADAKFDAQDAMPKGWYEDLNNSPTVECKFLKDTPDGSSCDLSDKREKVQITIRIVQSPK